MRLTLRSERTPEPHRGALSFLDNDVSGSPGVNPERRVETHSRGLAFVAGGVDRMVGWWCIVNPALDTRTTSLCGGRSRNPCAAKHRSFRVGDGGERGGTAVVWTVLDREDLHWFSPHMRAFAGAGPLWTAGERGGRVRMAPCPRPWAPISEMREPPVPVRPCRRISASRTAPVGALSAFPQLKRKSTGTASCGGSENC